MTEPRPPGTEAARSNPRRRTFRSAGVRPVTARMRRPVAARPVIPPLAEETALAEVERWMNAMAPDAA